MMRPIDQWLAKQLQYQYCPSTEEYQAARNCRERIELINHLQKWSISQWRMFLWVPQGKRDSLMEWETPSKEKLGRSGRSCEPMSRGQPMIPVRLLLWARRYIQRSLVETKAKRIQNWSVWSSMARRPRAGPQECVGRSDMHEGQTFEEPHM
jgi:hypothetical protein